MGRASRFEIRRAHRSIHGVEQRRYLPGLIYLCILPYDRFRALCEMVRWAQTESEVLHYSKIAHQCLKVMDALRPYLVLTLRNRTIVRGWLVGLTQGRNAEEDLSKIPTAWRGSIILQDGDSEIEFDFLEVETVRSFPAPVRLSDEIARTMSAKEASRWVKLRKTAN
jgi:hypothetical protein